MSNCDHWQEIISAWLDGEATPEEAKEVQEHLESCAACRQWLEQVETDRQSFVSSLMGRQADISQDVMRRVSEMSVEPNGVSQGPRKSFRLAELRVAAAMVAVVAAILFPVFARSREKARSVSCLSNIKQLALATLQYARDYDGMLPPAHDWAISIEPYVKNSQIFVCIRRDKPSLALPLAVQDLPHYAMAGNLSGANINELPDPAGTVMIYEVQQGQPAYLHNGGMNVGYADGHAKWIRMLPESVSQTTSMTTGSPGSNYGLRRRLKLAYDASCEVWVKQLQTAVVSAEQVFTDRGGFVLTSMLSQRPEAGAVRTASIEGRVPTTEVAATVNALAALGYVVHREIMGQDLTDQYVTRTRTVTQTEAEVGEAERQRQAATASRKAPVTAQVHKARQQLAGAQDALFGVERELALATICATFVERAPQASASAGQVGRAWRSFLHTATQVGVGLVWVGLYALFVVPAAVAVIAYRHWKR